MTKFLKCHVCGNIIIKIHDSGITPSCCNRPMTELQQSSGSGNPDAHIPVVTCLDDSTIKVTIGRTLHPMTDEHRIRFIYIETNKGGQIHYLKSESPPEAVFFTNDTPIAVYAYCNIHGLWKADIKTPEDCELQQK